MALRFRRTDKNIKVQYLILFAQLTQCRRWLFGFLGYERARGRCDVCRCNGLIEFRVFVRKRARERIKTSNIRMGDGRVNRAVDVGHCHKFVRCTKCIYVKSVSPHMLKATNERPHFGDHSLGKL